jgi:hypothetical protein
MSVHEEQSSRRLLVFFLGHHLEEMDKYGCGVDQGFSSWLQRGSRLLVMAWNRENHLDGLQREQGGRAPEESESNVDARR